LRHFQGPHCIPSLYPVRLRRQNGPKQTRRAGGTKSAKPSKNHGHTLSPDGQWRSFPSTPNLLQYVGSGVYYAGVEVRSKLICQSSSFVKAVSCASGEYPFASSVSFSNFERSTMVSFRVHS